MNINTIRGIPIMIIDTHYKKQIKTSSFKLLNWLLGIIYGYEIVYSMPDEKIYEINGRLFVNPNTFEKIKGVLK